MLLLDLANVSVRRGSRLALDGLSLQITEGEHVAILGPNGCGKSTLLKLLARECYPLRLPGMHLRIRGEEHWNIFDLRRHLGLVAGDLTAHLSRDITGFELVASGFFGSLGLPPRVVPTPEQVHRTRTVLAWLGALHLSDRWTDELSTGELRRLLIARALIHRPSTLVLDEPTTGLDIAAQRLFYSTLRQLAQSGHSLLLVTHHLEELIPEINRVVFLKAGRVIADGPKECVLTSSALSDLFEATLELEHTTQGYRIL